MTQGNRERRFGLFGGTFNPIHLGHLRAAEEVREALSLERIHFIPSRVPPHKDQDRNDPIAPAETRLAWVERAIAPYKHFLIDRVEIEREGPSYLVDTLEKIRSDTADQGAPGEAATPVFIVGEDAFAEMGEWRSPERLFAAVDFAIMTRPPGQLSRLESRCPEVVRSAFDFAADGRSARHKQAERRIELVSITALDISSSQIREACREQRSIRFLVPESIRSEIESSGEYARRGAPNG